MATDTGQENTSSHRDGTDAFVAECGRGAWRLEQICKAKDARTRRVLANCSDVQIKELMHVWDRPADRRALLDKLRNERSVCDAGCGIGPKRETCDCGSGIKP